ncbi:MAG: hypothetical protein FD123_2718 [Bacteroidetes bacterium]|nr:MAG: hypothetical protein FD123_2718 [Bacteroidota bacterium]
MRKILETGLLVLLLLLLFCPARAQLLERQVTIYDSAASPGYYFFRSFRMKVMYDTMPGQQVIMDGNGHTVYYRLTHTGSDFKMHANGIISFFGKDKFYLFDKNFRIIDSVSCVNGITTDSHDFVVLPDGHFLLLGQEIEQKDMSRYKIFKQKNLAGSKRAKVITGVIQELDANKRLVYEWRSAPHFRLEDAEKIYLNDTAKIDITHFNSVDQDSAGEYLLISVRYSNEIIKVQKNTGMILWRFGGKRNNIKLLNDSLPFLGQHDARFSGGNRMTLFDNGYADAKRKHAARAMEYEMDDAKKTAKLVWSYTRKPQLVSDAAGNAHRAANGYMLTNYGKIQNSKQNIMFDMVKPDGSKIIELAFKDTAGTYRAFYYPSLPFELPRPVISGSWQYGGYKLETASAGPRRWSNGDTAQLISPAVPGEYYLDIPYGDGGFLRSIPLKVTAKMLNGPDTLRSGKMNKAQEDAYYDLLRAYRESGGLDRVLAQTGFSMRCGSCETFGGQFMVSISDSGELLSCSIAKTNFYCKSLDEKKAMDVLLKSFTDFLRKQKFHGALRGKTVFLQTGFYSKC